MTDKLPSEQISEFLDFLKECQTEYEECVQEVWKHDKKQQDQLHDLEFASNYDERNKIATRIHKERVERREYKDRTEMVIKIAKFCSDTQNKPLLKRLKLLLEEQRKTEEFLLGERHYNRRGGDSDDSDRR